MIQSLVLNEKVYIQNPYSKTETENKHKTHFAYITCFFFIRNPWKLLYNSVRQ